MLIQNLNKHIKKNAKIAYKKIKRLRKKRSNLNIFLTTVSVVMIWRGVWWLLDLYLFPNKHVLSLVIWMIIWIFLLFVDDERLDELWEKTKSEEEIKL
jgi:hypothetical protein